MREQVANSIGRTVPPAALRAATIGHEPRPLLERFFPEVRAGGFTCIDGTIEFYTRVNALLSAEMTVVDFGAGRGAAFQDDPCSYRRRLRCLKGKVAKVIGVDVDAAVLQNPGLDEACRVTAGERIPLADASVDLVVSDFTLEHISSPEICAGELTRVLRPGGWLCARTPNRWSYVALATTLIPSRLHKSVLQWLQPERKAEDVFPTRYRMNDLWTICRLFPGNRFIDSSYTFSPEPAYLPQNALVWRAALAFERVCPAALKANLFIFLQKRRAEG